MGIFGTVLGICGVAFVRALGLSAKRHHPLLGMLNMKVVYMLSCISPKVALTPDQRILRSDCCEKCIMASSGSLLIFCTA